MDSVKLIQAKSIPSTKQLLPYVARMAPNWYEVGAMLLEVEQESQLKLIQATYGSDVKKCCLYMLQYWMDTHPEATWHHLIATLRSPGVDLAAVAADIEKNINVNHTQRNDNSSMTVNFAYYKNVADAFAELMRIFTDELDGAKFEPIRAICLTRASKRLQSEISKTTDVHSLFELLACNPFYFNWMKVEYLQTIAIASGNAKLQETLKCYTDVILSKTLGEIWNFVPSFHKTKTKYYSKIRAKFHGKDPDDIKVKDLKKYEPNFAKKIALHIIRIDKGSLTITWCIAAEEAYEAYLLALNVPREFREDDFLQIGMWVVYPPQFVIQELERVHTMMSTSTLLIAYYHGLLLRSIDADLLTDKMCSVGLLTAHEQIVISSGNSIYQKNWLLLEHVRHMDVQALRKFCEVVQEVWPQIGLQLITALKYRDVSTSDESHAVTSEVKQDDMEVADIDTTSSVSQLLFLHLIDQVHKLLQMYKLEVVQRCESLNASDSHKISLFSADQLTELSECDNLFMKLSPLLTWSNHSILKALASCTSEAVKLLDEFESKLDLLQPITSYPIPRLSSDMIPTDTSTYTILAVRCDKELYQCTLQYVYDVQSVVVEKYDITQHCLQLMAVRSDPTIFYWTIPKCVVYLINTNVPLHSEYLYSRGVLEVSVYPDLLLTIGDDVCYGSLVFECSDHLDEEEMADVSNSKEYNTEAMLKHVRSQCDYLRSELEHKTKYANALEEILEKQGNVIDQTQRQEEQIVMTTATDKQTDEDTFKDAFKTEPYKDELDEGSPFKLKVELSTKVEFTELKKEISELKKENEKLYKVMASKLSEEVNEYTLKIKELEQENKRLLSSMYRKSKDAHKISADYQTEKELMPKSETIKSHDKQLQQENRDYQSEIMIKQNETDEVNKSLESITEYQEGKQKYTTNIILKNPSTSMSVMPIRGKWKINVKRIDGAVLTIEIDQDATVRKLYRIVRHNLKVNWGINESESIQLINGSNPLVKNDSKMNAVSLYNGITLYVVHQSEPYSWDLFVKLPGKSSAIIVTLHESETCEDLYKKVMELQGSNSRPLCIKDPIGDDIPEAKMSIAQYLYDGASLTAEYRQKWSLMILQLGKSQSLTIEISPDCLVSQLYEEVNNKVGVGEEMRLVAGTKELNNYTGRRLCDPELGLKHGSSIGIVMRQIDSNDPRVQTLQNCPNKDVVGVPTPSIRACPFCGALVQHMDACKHMNCPACSRAFCFICLKKNEGGWQCGSYNSKCTPAPRQTHIPG